MKEILTLLLCASLTSARAQNTAQIHTLSYRQTLAQVMSSLPLAKKDPLTQTATIYRYILKHVDYDYETYFHTAHRTSAASALCEHKANCQGIAALFHDMCAYVHIDAPIVKGTFQKEAHVWNVVKLGRFYYNVDATLDDDSLHYFLTNDDDLSDHHRTTKMKAIAKTSLGMKKINYPKFKYYQYKAPKKVTIVYAYDRDSRLLKATQTLYHSNISTPMVLKGGKLTIFFCKKGDYAITLKNKQTGKFLNYYFYIH